MELKIIFIQKIIPQIVMIAGRTSTAERKCKMKLFK